MKLLFKLSFSTLILILFASCSSNLEEGVLETGLDSFYNSENFAKLQSAFPVLTDNIDKSSLYIFEDDEKKIFSITTTDEIDKIATIYFKRNADNDYSSAIEQFSLNSDKEPIAFAFQVVNTGEILNFSIEKNNETNSYKILATSDTSMAIERGCLTDCINAEIQHCLDNPPCVVVGILAWQYVAGACALECMF